MSYKKSLSYILVSLRVGMENKYEQSTLGPLLKDFGTFMFWPKSWFLHSRSFLMVKHNQALLPLSFENIMYNQPGWLTLSFLFVKLPSCVFPHGLLFCLTVAYLWSRWCDSKWGRICNRGLPDFVPFFAPHLIFCLLRGRCACRNIKTCWKFPEALVLLTAR